MCCLVYFYKIIYTYISYAIAFKKKSKFRVYTNNSYKHVKEIHKKLTRYSVMENYFRRNDIKVKIMSTKDETDEKELLE